MTIPSVEIIVADNGVNTSLQLPQQNVQVVLGCSSQGAPNVPFATTVASKLTDQFGYGPMPEAAGLVCSAGGTVIAVQLPIITPGTAKAVQKTGTGTSVVTTTLDGTVGAFDDYFVVVQPTLGGTIATGPVQIQVSLDAGRHFGPLINLGTAATYVIPNTGIALNFAAGTLVAGDTYKFQTIAPQWNISGVQAAIAALAASVFAVQGWGSMHLVGPISAADAATVNGYIDSLRTRYNFARILLSARDAAAPTAWGGSGETEAAWMTSLETAFSATDAKRIVVSGGYYNTPSSFPNAAAGTPSYRRSGQWASAARRVQIQPNNSTWRVRDGSLANIVVDPTTDPGDGFIYHDEAQTPGLDAARLMSFRTWPKKQGIFCTRDPLMSGVGSQFTLLPYGNVIDVACTIGYETGVEIVGDDLLTNPNGTLQSQEALKLQNGILGAINDNMTAVGMISSAVVAVDLNANVQSTGNVPVSITITQRTVIGKVTETVGLSIPFAAPTSP
jgi:hypothetical protein